MNNNDERDSAEERYNASLLRDERDPDGEPEEDNPDSFREVRVTLTVRVPAGETATAAEVGQAIDGALDEPGYYGNDWGQWVVGGVTAAELPEAPAGDTPRVEISLSRPADVTARDMYLAAVTAISQVTILTYAGHEVAAVVPWPAPEHDPDDEAIIVTAGEYWDHYGSEDGDDILNTLQHAAIHRAVTLFREHTGEEPPRDLTADVKAFLAEQLNRDDASLAEIAAQVVRIATGAATYEPLDDDDDDDPELTGSESPVSEF
jgi:hypothetical protein